MTENIKSIPISAEINELIEGHAKAMGAVGGVAGPFGAGIDIPVIAADWSVLAVCLANETDLQLDRQAALKLTTAVATGVGAFVAGTKIASTVLGWVLAPLTGFASVAASAAFNGGLNYVLTAAFGRACARYFLQTDEIGTVEVVAAILIGLIAADMGWDMKGGGA